MIHGLKYESVCEVNLLGYIIGILWDLWDLLSFCIFTTVFTEHEVRKV